jgi:general secretion pathway protein G
MTIAPTIRPVRFILVVAAWLALVAAHLWQVRSARDTVCRRHRSQAMVMTTEQALAHFEADYDRRPRVLSQLPRQHYLMKVPRDAWNRPLRLTCPTRHNDVYPCDISSAGPDGIFGTADDINSWDL